MPLSYSPKEIDKKWQARWEQDRLYAARDADTRPKFYALTMFPYTSGDLHIGHWYAMAPADACARYKRMQGFNVMHPMGFDAFGLPAENAAIARGIHPYAWTMKNIENMRRQLRSMGSSYDWSREVITCLPEYYRWTQWFFLKLYKAGLAYRGKAPVNWCPKCQTVLANEQVVGAGVCDRCGTPVTRRELEQWFRDHYRCGYVAQRLWILGRGQLRPIGYQPDERCGRHQRRWYHVHPGSGRCR